MKKKNHRTRRITAILLTAIIIAAGCAISASAAAERWSWTVNVSATGSDSMIITAAHSGTRSDTFGSYITVYNGKSYTEGNTYVWQDNKKKGLQNYQLYGNTPSHPTINFGTINKGQSQHYYSNTYGGFKSTVDSYQYY